MSMTDHHLHRSDLNEQTILKKNQRQSINSIIVGFKAIKPGSDAHSQKWDFSGNFNGIWDY